MEGMDVEEEMGGGDEKIGGGECLGGGDGKEWVVEEEEVRR